MIGIVLASVDISIRGNALCFVSIIQIFDWFYWHLRGPLCVKPAIHTRRSTIKNDSSRIAL